MNIETKNLRPWDRRPLQSASTIKTQAPQVSSSRQETEVERMIEMTAASSDRNRDSNQAFSSCNLLEDRQSVERKFDRQTDHYDNGKTGIEKRIRLVSNCSQQQRRQKQQIDLELRRAGSRLIQAGSKGIEPKMKRTMISSRRTTEEAHSPKYRSLASGSLLLAALIALGPHLVASAAEQQNNSSSSTIKWNLNGELAKQLQSQLANRQQQQSRLKGAIAHRKPPPVAALLAGGPDPLDRQQRVERMFALAATNTSSSAQIVALNNGTRSPNSSSGSLSSGSEKLPPAASGRLSASPKAAELSRRDLEQNALDEASFTPPEPVDQPPAVVVDREQPSRFLHHPAARDFEHANDHEQSPLPPIGAALLRHQQEEEAFSSRSGLLQSPSGISALSDGFGGQQMASLLPAHRGSQIKVVFNNNPHFIIGREGQPLSLEGRSGRRSQHSSAFQGDDYHSADESKLDETKILVSGQQRHSSLNQIVEHDNRPCEKKSKVQLPPNIEQINLSSRDPTRKSPPQRQPFVEEPQVKVEEPQIVAQQKTEPPPPIVEQQQQQKQLQVDDEQVITPFEQIVKSGMRPPLRMVISMRNKNGDTMKVPINLLGSHSGGKKPQVSTFDFGPQMQIHFEPQEQAKEQQQKAIDDNTPIGGDLFDPSLALTKSRPPKPVDPLPVPIPEAPMPQVPIPATKTKARGVKTPPRSPVQEPVQQQEQEQYQTADEEPPIVQQEVVKPLPMSPQRPPAKSLPPVVVKGPQVGKLPPVEEQQRQEPPHAQEQQPPEPPVVASPPIKSEPADVPPPPIVEQRPTEQQEVLPEQVPVKKADCNDSQQRKSPEEVDDALQQQKTGEALIQMMMPTMNAFQNKTFATMFAQFQKALSDMHSATQLQQQQSPVEQVNEEQPRPRDRKMGTRELQLAPQQVERLPQPQSQVAQQREQQRRQQQQFEEQEDLVVALMAANMSSSLGPMDGQKQLSMTVITPPRGASLQDVIRTHADPSTGDPSRTVAILHSIRSRLNNGNNNDAQISPLGQSMDQGPAQMGDRNDQKVESRPFAVEVQLRRGGNPNPDQSQPADELPQRPAGVSGNAGDSADPDGFASSSHQISISASSSPNKRQPPHRKPSGRLHNREMSEIKVRFRRSLGGARGLYGLQLEPSERLVDRRATQGSGQRNSNGAQAQDVIVGAASSESGRQQEAPGGDELDEGEDYGEESAPNSRDSRPSTEQKDSGADDQEEEASDLDPDMNLDSDGSSFDSDDEPFNQGASSNDEAQSSADYNAPTSFEIPQIEINPNTLKQRGCRTVLREVQEIPMNGLGAVQADGRPGSGFSTGGPHQSVGPNGRHKRQADGGGGNSANLINSRKVTSIVMTKECHFPNEPQVDTNTTPAPTNRLPPAQRPTQQEVSSQVTSVAQPQVTPAPPSDLAAQPAAQFLRQPSTRTEEKPQVAGTGNSQQQQEASTRSALRRRSVDASAKVNPSPAQPKGWTRQRREPRSRDEIHLAADSKRNEVVARKLYKPPSEDDPYHTLSYSSRNGADPDADQSAEEPDDSLMDGEGSSPDETPGASIQQQRRSNEQHQRQMERERLSEQERRALLDPDHDDTDPPAAGQRGPRRRGQEAAAGNDDLDEEPSGDSRVRANSREGPEESSSDEESPADASANEEQEEPSDNRRRLGKSFKFQHEAGRPRGGSGGHSRAELQLKPGERRVEQSSDRQQVDPSSDDLDLDSEQPEANKRQSEPKTRATSSSDRRSDEIDELNADLENDEDEPSADGRRAAASDEAPNRGPQEGGAGSTSEEVDPDADPEYNSPEAQVPANSKPKKVAKSFAYVHRDLPKKGSKNPDDFVVSYGRGNLQTELEDYDSDRETPLIRTNSNDPPQRRNDDDSGRPQQQEAAATTNPQHKPATQNKQPQSKVVTSNNNNERRPPPEALNPVELASHLRPSVLVPARNLQRRQMELQFLPPHARAPTTLQRRVTPPLASSSTFSSYRPNQMQTVTRTRRYVFNPWL